MPSEGIENRKAVLNAIRDAEPAASASEIAEEVGLSKVAVRKHLTELKERPNVQSREIGQVPVYWTETEIDLTFEQDEPNVEIGFVVGEDEVGDKVQSQIDNVAEWAEDKFVGLQTAPETAIHPNDGPTEPGDEIQLHVTGIPGHWNDFGSRSRAENGRDQLAYEECSSSEADVLLTGTVYSKPTVPIEHTPYPDDYDLEERAQLSPWLFEPVNDAAFLKDVSVDWISPLEYPREVAGIPPEWDEMQSEDEGQLQSSEENDE